MKRSDMDRTRLVRAWLAEGGTELSPRVLDGVLRQMPTTTQDRPFWASEPPSLSTLAAGVSAAAALVVVVVGAGILGGAPPGGTPLESAGPTSIASPDIPSPTSAPDEFSVGFIGLPPIGAMPTVPTPTELVERYAWVTHSGFFYLGGAFVYADGRLIWNQYDMPERSALDPSRSTGWLEQRLTAEGIDLVVELGIGPADPEVGRRLERVEVQELPEGAWADQTLRPYVPNGYAVCLSVSDQVSSAEVPDVTPSEQLAMLPVEAAGLLRESPQSESHVYSPGVACYELPLSDARRLDVFVREAGFDQDPGENRWLLEYHTPLDLEGTGRKSAPRLNVWFEPLLPDGTFTCSGCG